MRILLQFPEGLKKIAAEYASKFEKDGHTVYLSGSKCFGGCDVAIDEAIAVGAERIIHFGHSQFPINPGFSEKAKNAGIEIEYVEYKIDIDSAFITKAIKFLQASSIPKITIVMPVQHLHEMERIIGQFETSGIPVILGKGTKTTYPGQILGCDTSAAFTEHRTDILYIGGGRFHYLALYDNMEPPDVKVIIANPFSGEIKIINDEITAYVKQRKGMVVKAMEANKFGILVSTKPGQFNMASAEKIKEELKALGKESQIIASSEFDWLALQDFMWADAFINTACPRIAEDWEKAGKPVVNVSEFSLLKSLLK